MAGWRPWLPLALGLAVLAAPARAQDAEVARLLDAAHGQVGVTVAYDPSYVRLAYPGGDVPRDRGVCTDVVVRALRATGHDLQQLVHEDMRRNFGAYPRAWGLSGTDRNIDHRRVPNLETWFRRKGHGLPVSRRAADYKPGDFVSWRLPSGPPHIGIVSDRKASDGSGRPLIVHNLGAGVRVEDVLFAWTPVGHFRFFPPTDEPPPPRSR